MLFLFTFLGAPAYSAPEDLLGSAEVVKGKYDDILWQHEDRSLLYWSIKDGKYVGQSPTPLAGFEGIGDGVKPLIIEAKLTLAGVGDVKPTTSFGGTTTVRSITGQSERANALVGSTSAMLRKSIQNGNWSVSAI